MTQCIAILIAAVVALIAVLQFVLARDKFKLDMFEKRFAIFKATESFLNDAIGSHGKVSTERLQRFDSETQTASFLFGQDIVDFLKQIRDSANNTSWWRKQQESHEGASQERMDLGQKTMEVLEAFIEEQNKLKERFSPYLKFKVWKHWLFW